MVDVESLGGRIILEPPGLLGGKPVGESLLGEGLVKLLWDGGGRMDS